MTPQERALLEDFLDKLASVRGVDKDGEADALIRQRAGSQPDALYLTIQRALLLEQALEGSQQRIAALQQQVADLEAAARGPAKSSGSFLGGLLGGDLWGRPSAPASPPAATLGSRIGQGAAGRRPLAPPASASAQPMGSGMGNFLGNAAAAAAGVAGGMFLFNGIQHLLGDNGAAATPSAGDAAASAAETPVAHAGDHVGDPAHRESDAAQDHDAAAQDDGWFDEGGSFSDDDLI
ncbi:MAG: DUF2076 family protein [Pigmentiphaga sp.]|uniref:DUF2076 family protein n=1 Tax=Pigmentiphaga sp. TaxID=1977564 RepID=UPI0029A7878E|nr:DUF2076 family protein [Pigmentiphaga sp.]MDX3905989.1 DUF2076 family protein [Pigmentiphaga sp.]